VRFTTKQDAIEQGIAPALTEGEFDTDSIFAEAYAWAIDKDDDGNELPNTGGFEQTVTDDEFWTIVQRHELTPDTRSRDNTGRFVPEV
jgi:hypothetical protein